MSLCVHCHRTKSNRPRGLCWSCYYTPGVRDLFPSTSKYHRRGVADFDHVPGLPEPTTVPPGPEKVLVLEARAAAGLSLWHPEDARHGL